MINAEKIDYSRAKSTFIKDDFEWIDNSLLKNLNSYNFYVIALSELERLLSNDDIKFNSLEYYYFGCNVQSLIKAKTDESIFILNIDRQYDTIPYSILDKMDEKYLYDMIENEDFLIAENFKETDKYCKIKMEVML